MPQLGTCMVCGYRGLVVQAPHMGRTRLECLIVADCTTRYLGQAISRAKVAS